MLNAEVERVAATPGNVAIPPAWLQPAVASHLTLLGTLFAVDFRKRCTNRII